MKEFKYAFRKGSKKNLCPNCNKKTFVPYIKTETGDELPEGRCDREQKCGFHSKPESNDIVFIQKKEVEEVKTDYIPLEKLDYYFQLKNTSNFYKWLLSKFSKKEVVKAEYDYLLSARCESIIFWQIDQLERVRSGKIMDYNPSTGKRIKDKDGKSHISWMHKQPHNLKQCLFGLHLTKEDKSKTIAVVESEKTAVIMSMYVPDFLWLATGSKSGFKKEYLCMIKTRKIIGFPDKGCFNEWQERADDLNNFGYNIAISDIIEKSDCDEGLDIADLYLKL